MTAGKSWGSLNSSLGVLFSPNFDSGIADQFIGRAKGAVRLGVQLFTGIAIYQVIDKMTGGITILADKNTLGRI